MPTPYYNSSEDETTATDSFNFQALAHVLLEKIWLIALCIVAAGFLAVLSLRHTDKVYSAKAVLQVEQETPRVINIDAVQVEDFKGIDFLKTVEQAFQSRAVFERVLDANKLAEDERFDSQEPGGTPRSKSSLVSRLQGVTDIRLRPGTRLIDVTVEHENPELTALIANSLVDEFLRQNNEHQASTSKEATEFLRLEADRLQKELRDSESALQAYKEKTQFIPSESEQNGPVHQIRTQLESARAERLRLATEYAQFQRSKDNLAVLQTIPSVATDSTVHQLQTLLTAQETTVAQVKQRYLHKHQKYIDAHLYLTNLQSALAEAIYRVGDTLKTSHENALASETALLDQYNKEKASAIDSGNVAIEHNSLASKVEANRTLYANVLNRLKETDLTKDLALRKARIIQRAEVPEKPFKPQKERTLALGLAGGLALGILLALGLGAMDSSFKSLDEVEEYLRLPVLSTIPRLASSQIDSTHLVMGQNSTLSGAESFRSLRTSLSLMTGAQDQRVFLFTSALPEEGKTFCSLNYAYSLAQQGLRVLLIDCDLRRPAVEEALTGTYGQLAGLSDYLTDSQCLNGAIHETGIQNYYYMPAGSPVSNPSELLSQDRFHTLLEDALSQFDRVVLDSAPIFGVSDTLLMVDRTHVACLVVKSHKTPRKKVRRAVHILRNAGAPLAGVVLNSLSPNDRRNDDDPYYDYGYASKSENIVPLERVS